MAKLFSQKPSDVALLPHDVGRVGRFLFDKTIAAFGQAVHASVEQAGQSSNQSIAQAQKVREWERIMGGDGASAFRDVDGELSRSARVVGQDKTDDDDDLDIDGSYW